MRRWGQEGNSTRAVLRALTSSHGRREERNWPTSTALWERHTWFLWPGRVRQGIRAAESQSKTGTGIEWIATSEVAKEVGATPALLITITWVLTIGIWLIQCHQPRKFFRLQGAQLSGSRKRRRMPLYRKGKDGQTELDFQSSRERKVPPRFFLQVWTFHFSDINQSNPAKEIPIFFDGMVKGFQSRLILRPLTRRSNPVFKRVSWFTCWISPESLYFHGEGLNTIIGSSPLLHSSWYGFLVFLYL